MDYSFDILTDNKIREAIADTWMIPCFEFYNEAESTQDIARMRAGENAPEWTLILADHQIAGRGQHGRTWLADPGRSLLFSMIVRPRTFEEMALLPIRTGLAIAQAVDSLCEESSRRTMRAMLKWPNDIVMDGGKAGGILYEGHIQGERFYAVLGVGLNIYPQHFDALPSLLPPAFISEFLSSRIHRLDILSAIIPALRISLSEQAGLLTAFELEEFASRDWLYGRVLKSPVEGCAIGINARGHLLVERKDGEMEAVVGGTVELM